MLIGVFDSGKGGQFVAAKLRHLLPHHDFEVVDDHNHVPYGERTNQEIIRLTREALQPLLKKVTVIVIACNTATAVAIDTLREEYPTHFFIGYEPMLKPLAEKSDHGIVLATQATRNSSRYELLKEAYASHVWLEEPDTTGWAATIEEGESAIIDFTEIEAYVAAGANIISISCTHYLAIEQRLKDTFPDVIVIEPTEAVARRIETIVSRLQQLA